MRSNLQYLFKRSHIFFRRDLIQTVIFIEMRFVPSIFPTALAKMKKQLCFWLFRFYYYYDAIFSFHAFSMCWTVFLYRLVKLSLYCSPIGLSFHTMLHTDTFSQLQSIRICACLFFPHIETFFTKFLFFGFFFVNVHVPSSLVIFCFIYLIVSIIYWSSRTLIYLYV